mgnify:CR=1 FL=1
MKLSRLLFLFVAAVSLAAQLTGAAAEEDSSSSASLRGAAPRKEEDERSLQGNSGRIPGAYVVQLSDDVDPADLPGRIRGLLNAMGRAPDFVFKHSIKGFAVQGLTDA